MRVEFANDPDVCIREVLASGRYRNIVAIEIKGGRDISNIHNRNGEAEKSHQKARIDGFVECWTILGVSKIAPDAAQRESPATDRFFYLEELMKPDSNEAIEFREAVCSLVGVHG